jgi:tetratricopeptide (TPR) repeat protein
LNYKVSTLRQEWRVLGYVLWSARTATLAALCLALISPSARAQGPRSSGNSSSEEVSLRLILVDSPEKAHKVVERLNKGEDFGALAKEVSTDPTADADGFMGTFVLSAVRSELRDALGGIQPGQISAVIKIPAGYAILKLISRKAASSSGESGVKGPQSTLSFSSSRATGRQMPVTSGVPAVEPAFFSMEKPAGWNRDMGSICRYHQDSISQAQERMANLLKPESYFHLSATDQLGVHYVSALLESYQGHLPEAISHWEEAYRIAQASLPDNIPLMEEVLGDAYFHEAEMENNVYHKPGERCLYPPRAGSVYPKFQKTEKLEKAMQHFQNYLDRKPDDLQVKWMMNLAYMMLGKYPDEVPPRYLITAPAAVEEEGAGVGRFVDVAPEAGLDITQISGGLIVDDFENNGLFDVVTTGYDACGQVHFYHNNGDGTFSDRSAESGLAKIAGAANLIQTDYNNDGCIDILALRGGWQVPMPLTLLRNNCDGTFTDVTHEAGLDDHLFATQTAAWADIDNDGWLDVLIADEQGPLQLYHNRGDGTFQNISALAGVDKALFAKGVVSEDYDNDGYPDFFVTNLRGDNLLLHNNHDKTFTDVAEHAGVQTSWFSFGTWFFDYDNDGWPDLFIANDEPSLEETMRTYAGLSHKVGTIKLYRNMRNGTFEDVTSAVGLDKVFMPMGATYGDVDNDGFLDFYLGTGNPEYGALVPDVLMRNMAGKKFSDITVSSGTGDLHKTHAIVFADVGNTGNEDLVAEMGGAAPSDAHALRFYRNPGHDNRWIAIKLVGVKTNRAAIGARITVKTKNHDGSEHAFYRTVNSRGSWGSAPLEQHVGLGPAEQITGVEVWWPTSNTRQEFTHVGTNQFIRIKEFARDYTKMNRKKVRIGGAIHQASSARKAKGEPAGTKAAL